MHNKSKLFLILIVIGLILPAISSFIPSSPKIALISRPETILNTNNWIDDGTPIITLSNNQQEPQICSDGAGGSIITWEDYRSSNADIYTQRINSTGDVQWQTNGIPICSTADRTENPQICSDGSGGAIITWTLFGVSNEDDIYAQRINAAGSALWTLNGTVICNYTAQQGDARICSDGTGGAIICWFDMRNGNKDFYAQRINAAGTLLWNVSGVPICTNSASQANQQLCSDNASGAFITWDDYRRSNYDVFAQRVNATGQVQWTINGIPICTERRTQNYPQICSDNANGTIITWGDMRGTDSDIYAQRIDAQGNALWLANGTPISTMNKRQQFPQIARQKSGVVIVWQDNRSDTWDIYGQRLSWEGNSQWSANGTPICTSTSTPRDIQVCGDGMDGAYVVWTDDDVDGYDICIQYVSTYGSWQWSVGGAPICTAGNTQSVPKISGDHFAGVIVVWEDFRSVNRDIYAGSLLDFGLRGPQNWVQNQTPTVICEFFANHLNISTVQYAFATDGSSTPTNWMAVEGVYAEAACTTAAPDGSTGYLFARVVAVPFNQDSGTLNTIRFRATDMFGNLGLQHDAFIISIDTTDPLNFNIVSPAGETTDQTPTIICAVSDSLSGINISTVSYAYSITGNMTPNNWAPVDGVYTDLACTVNASNGFTGTAYLRVAAVPFNQISETLNTIRFRVTDIAGNVGIQLTVTISIVKETGPGIGYASLTLTFISIGVASLLYAFIKYHIVSDRPERAKILLSNRL